MIQLEDLVLPVTISLWFAMATWFFYWLFLMEDIHPKDKRKRSLYFWGWVRFCSSTLTFTIGGVFFNMQKEEWNTICQFVQDHTTKIIAGSFWAIAAAILVYFLVYRGLKRRKKLGI